MFFVLAAGVLTALAVIYLIGRFPDAVEGEGGINLVRSLAVLTFLGATAILHRRAMKTSHVFLSILAWLAVGVVLFTGYSYRYELSQIGDRLLGELIPSGGIEVTGGAVSIRVNKSGHFVVEAVVDGVSLAVELDNEEHYDAIRDALVETNARLRRMSPRRHQLTDIFRSDR